MAKYNEILVGRYNRALQKLFGIKGPAPAPQLASEIIAEISMPWGVENRYLEQVELFATRVLSPGGVAAISGIRIRNPVASNLIAVLQLLQAVYFVGVADAFRVIHGQATADLASAVDLTNAGLDSRGRPSPTLRISFTSAAAVPALTNAQVIFAAGVAGGSQVSLVGFDNQELPIVPGDAYQVEGTTLNTDLRVNVNWRERFLEESERT
jgi:hypothetical protein